MQDDVIPSSDAGDYSPVIAETLSSSPSRKQSKSAQIPNSKTQTQQPTTISNASFFATTVTKANKVKQGPSITLDLKWTTVNHSEPGRETLDESLYPSAFRYCIQASGFDDAMPDLKEAPSADLFK
eukprot:13479656-Ditylum_brightwellii.AAC.1